MNLTTQSAHAGITIPLTTDSQYYLEITNEQITHVHEEGTTSIFLKDLVEISTYQYEQQTYGIQTAKTNHFSVGGKDKQIQISSNSAFWLGSKQKQVIYDKLSHIGLVFLCPLVAENLFEKWKADENIQAGGLNISKDGIEKRVALFFKKTLYWYEFRNCEFAGNGYVNVSSRSEDSWKLLAGIGKNVFVLPFLLKKIEAYRNRSVCQHNN